MKKINYFLIGISFFLLSAMTIPAGAQNVIQGNWQTQAYDYMKNIGQRYTFYFPTGGTLASTIWGTDIYTYDCSIATAAVHMGLISTQSGGKVTIEIRPGQASYKGTTRNGVTSRDYGAFGGSFIFVDSYGKQIIPVAIIGNVIEGNWQTQASDYIGNIGQRYTFHFPAGVPSDRVWGTDVYTYDCSIASAAVHAGLISAQTGGTVTIEMRAGQASYKGTTRNGVTSKDYGAFGGSFIFVKGNVIKPITTGNLIQGTWGTQANDYSQNIGQRYTFYFPPGGSISSRLWGTDIYTYDCSIASAAVHAGLITTQNGGTVTIEIRPGQSFYKGTVRNGVTSHDWGAFGGSFIFIIK